MSCNCKKSTSQCEFDKFPEYYNRLQYVEDTILKLISEMFEDDHPQDRSDEYLDRADPSEIPLYHLDLEELNKLEIEQIRRLIARLARKLASRYSLRYKRAKHGSVDLRRTMQHAFSSSGGVPVKLGYKKRIISRPEIILICDVSESVANFSQFMFQLVYSIQNRFNFVRSFLFVDMIDEVTCCFKNRDVEKAIDDALMQGEYSSGVFSDYGRVFDIFAKKYLPEVSRRATVIVLGDARNNHFPTFVKSFEKISEHVRKVIWLNPQPREEWNDKDNIMDVYESYCDQVFECRNIKQLEKAMEEII